MTATRNMTFPDELYEKLKREAELKGLSVASLIKLACSQYLEGEEIKRNQKVKGS